MTVVMLLVVGLASPSLSETHRVFLEHVAHFLLTTSERERFLELESDELRDRFIERFWREHDLAVHTERLLACDRLFGARGRWSERGRIYQWLGPPSYREELTRAGHRLVPTELWHYTGVEVSFLPQSFYLVFFRSGGAGRFRLWDPVADGIRALVASAEPNRSHLVDDTILENIDPELALAAESLVPGGGRRETQSLLASLSSLPATAERERTFDANVRAWASTRQLPSRLVTSTWRDDAGVPELHYALELSPGAADELRWREDGSRYRARLTLIGRLLGAELERERWEDSIELDVSETERRTLTTTRLVFRGRRMLTAGDERFDLTLVNEGASVAVSASLEATPAPDEATGSEADAVGAARFREELDRGSIPARVLERSRTRAEERRYRFARGLALAKRGSLERAIDELETAAELEPEDVRVHLELARILYASRRYADVLSHLSSLGTRWDGEVDLWVLRAGAAASLGRAGAVTYYEKALALDPGNAAIADALARARNRLR